MAAFPTRLPTGTGSVAGSRMKSVPEVPGQQPRGMDGYGSVRLAAGQARLQCISHLVEQLDLLVLLVELDDLGRQRRSRLCNGPFEAFVLGNLGVELARPFGDERLHLFGPAQTAQERDPGEAGEQQAADEDCPRLPGTVSGKEACRRIGDQGPRTLAGVDRGAPGHAVLHDGRSRLGGVIVQGTVALRRIGILELEVDACRTELPVERAPPSGRYGTRRHRFPLPRAARRRVRNPGAAMDRPEVPHDLGPRCREGNRRRHSPLAFRLRSHARWRFARVS